MKGTSFCRWCGLNIGPSISNGSLWIHLGTEKELPVIFVIHRFDVCSDFEWPQSNSAQVLPVPPSRLELGGLKTFMNEGHFLLQMVWSKHWPIHLQRQLVDSPWHGKRAASHIYIYIYIRVVTPKNEGNVSLWFPMTY